MINTTNSYKVRFVKKSGKGNTMFSIGDYDKDKPDETRYYNVVAFNSIVLQDGDYITIDQIKTVGSNEYKAKDGTTKTSVTICGIVKQSVPPVSKQAQDKPNTAPEPETSPTINNDDDFNTGPLLDISADDLPF